MKITLSLAFAVVALAPALATAQESSPVLADLDRPLPRARDFLAPDPVEPRLEAPALKNSALPPPATASGSSFRTVVLQEEFTPRLRATLALYGRIDFPGATDIDSNGNTYADIFDLGYGVGLELSLLGGIGPHFAMGPYISVGWDRFVGSSNVDVSPVETFSFNDMDVTTVVVGGKIVERVAPFFFWEGYMGVGFVHYGQLTYTDEFGPPPNTGLQFFRPINRGLFDIGGRACWGTPYMTFDLGLDFRFMGATAPGRDVNPTVVDPDFFFTFTVELGLSLRF